VDSRPEIAMIDRRNPFRDIERMFEQLSDQFEDAARRWEDQPSLEWSESESMRSMSIDLADKDDEFVVTADLPGFEKDEIDVTVMNTDLKISAEHEAETEEREENYLRHERTRRSMSRSIRLPESVVEDDVSATYKNGVLTVRLPKTEPVEEGHEIDIE
jgi:HSP20 family protein